MSAAAAQALWTGQAVLEATGGIGASAWSAQGVSIDSRTLQPQDLFVALQGEVHDGHGFLKDAFNAGAAAALVARECGKHKGAQIQVNDPLKALENLAAHARARSHAKVVAITGSVGKTGIKDALGHVLSNALSAQVHVSARSYNNHWGVPLSLARLPVDAGFGVFEVGMNHAGEITPLTRLIAPDVALISAVRPAHMEFFSSLEEVADAKAEIFLGLREGGVAVLGRDDPSFERLQAAAISARANILTFGASPDADIRLLSAKERVEGSHIEVDIDGKRIDYDLGVPGSHWIANSLAVLACCHALGLDCEKIATAFASLQTPPGRGNQHRLPWNGGEVLLIDESYNANPASMEAAIETLGKFQGGRRIAALGDMFELGEKSRHWHLSLQPAIEAADISLTFTCGEQMRHLFDALSPERQGSHCSDAASLAEHLKDILQAGDILMVKGSNGMGMKIVLERLKAAERN